jgi:tripartite-type tricarboxylate transporter receptor subunit TctC
MRSFKAIVVLVVPWLLLNIKFAAAESVEDFYRGKQIEFIIAVAPPASVDSWGRLYARHLPKYIPGAPIIIPKNMPGAANVIALNYLYNQARRDGTALGITNSGVTTQGLLGNKGVRFKVGEFNWLGSPESVRYVCVANEQATVKTGADLFSEELVVGGSAQSIATPLLLNKLLGMKFKVVPGYSAAANVFLAMQRGEVNGICQTLSSIENRSPGWIAQGKLRVLFNLERDPISNVAGITAPSVYSFTKTEEQRQIITLNNETSALGRPIFTTPDVPKERLEALLQAVAEVVQDKEFIDEAKKQGLEIDPIGPDKLKEIIDRLARTPQAVVDRLTELIGKPLAGD